MDDSERDRLQLSVTDVLTGLSLQPHVEWDSTHAFRVFVNLPQPLRPGATRILKFRYVLPHAVPRLWRGGTERISWAPRSSTNVRRMEYEIVIDDLPVNRTLTVLPLGVSSSVVQANEGSWRITGSETELPLGKPFGFALTAS